MSSELLQRTRSVGSVGSTERKHKHHHHHHHRRHHHHHSSSRSGRHSEDGCTTAKQQQPQPSPLGAIAGDLPSAADVMRLLAMDAASSSSSSSSSDGEAEEETKRSASRSSSACGTPSVRALSPAEPQAAAAAAAATETVLRRGPLLVRRDPPNDDPRAKFAGGGLTKEICVLVRTAAKSVVLRKCGGGGAVVVEFAAVTHISRRWDGKAKVFAIVLHSAAANVVVEGHPPKEETEAWQEAFDHALMEVHGTPAKPTGDDDDDDGFGYGTCVIRPDAPDDQSGGEQLGIRVLELWEENLVSLDRGEWTEGMEENIMAFKRYKPRKRLPLPSMATLHRLTAEAAAKASTPEPAPRARSVGTPQQESRHRHHQQQQQQQHHEEAPLVIPHDVILVAEQSLESLRPLPPQPTRPAPRVVVTASPAAEQALRQLPSPPTRPAPKPPRR